MNTKLRYFFGTVIPPGRTGALWLTLAFTLSGCAAMRESSTENSPVPTPLETKLQPGPTPPARVMPLPPGPVAVNAGATGAKTTTPPLSAPVPTVVTSAEPARETARTFVGTGNFVKQTPPAPSPPGGAEEFTLNFEDLDIRQIVQYILGDYLK